MDRRTSWAAIITLLCLASVAVTTRTGWAAEADGLQVRSNPTGGLMATATVHLPAPPAAVQQVLTDYERWPTLFTVTIDLARVVRHAGLVLVDLSIKHPFLPIESRLVCENRELPEGGLVTTLISGDFKQYHRSWRLGPDGSPTATRADFELLVEVDTVAPDWLVAFELRRQLRQHFELLRQAVQRKSDGY